MERATPVEPMESFDLRDTIIPFSLLQIAHHVQHMKVGEEIEVFGNDAGIAGDLKSILPATAVTIQTVKTIEGERPRYRWRVKKKSPYHPDTKGGASCLKSI